MISVARRQFLRQGPCVTSAWASSFQRGSWRCFSTEYGLGTHGDAATMAYLRNLRNGAEVYLVGTAHISRRSADEVRRVIQLVKPGTVMVELDDERARSLMAASESNERHSVLAEVLKALGAPGDITQKILGASMKGMYAVVKHSGMEPGLEFKVALKEAEKLNAKVVLGDRHVHETLRRLSQEFSLPDLIKSMLPLSLQGHGVPPPPPELLPMFEGKGSLEETVERLKRRETVKAMTDYMRKLHPGAVRVMLDERDDYLCNSLLACEGRVVGVVGLAHLEGIERRWAEAMQSQEQGKKMLGNKPAV